MRGTFTFKPLKANLTHNTELLTKMDPYCSFTLGSQKFKTQICKSGGKNPVWNDEIRVPIDTDQQFCYLQLLDQDRLTKDDNIGTATIDLFEIMNNTNRFVSKWYPIFYKNKSAGEILIEIGFQPSGQNLGYQQGNIGTQNVGYGQGLGTQGYQQGSNLNYQQGTIGQQGGLSGYNTTQPLNVGQTYGQGLGTHNLGQTGGLGGVGIGQTGYGTSGLTTGTHGVGQTGYGTSGLTTGTHGVGQTGYGQSGLTTGTGYGTSNLTSGTGYGQTGTVYQHAGLTGTQGVGQTGYGQSGLTTGTGYGTSNLTSGTGYGQHIPTGTHSTLEDPLYGKTVNVHSAGVHGTSGYSGSTLGTGTLGTGNLGYQQGSNLGYQQGSLGTRDINQGNLGQQGGTFARVGQKIDQALHTGTGTGTTGQNLGQQQHFTQPGYH